MDEYHIVVEINQFKHQCQVLFFVSNSARFKFL